MAISRLLQAFLISTIAVLPAEAAERKFTINSDFTSFTGGYGSVRETGFDSHFDFGRTTLVVGGSQGQRKVNGDKFSAFRLSGTVYHDWSDRFFTRSSVSGAANKPVFARREVANEFNFKLRPNAVLTAGGKYAEYYGGKDVLSWNAGGTYYFGGGLVTYRFSQYDSKGLKSSYGHMLTARIKDPKGKGSSQLWLGAGTALHDQEQLATVQNGKFRSITLQRIQPLTGNLALTVGAGRTWYTANDSKYAGNSGTIGLTFTR